MNLQLTIVANTVAKYVLHGIDLYSENPWENKAVFMLYTELAIGFVKVEQLFNCFCLCYIQIYFLLGGPVRRLHWHHDTHLHIAAIRRPPHVPNDARLQEGLQRRHLVAQGDQ